MNKTLATVRGILLTIFSIIFNLIPALAALFGLFIFFIFDGNVFNRLYGFVIIAVGLVILLVVQLVLNFKTNKVCQLIVAITFTIDLGLYIAFTIYVFQKKNVILDDFLGKKFSDDDFTGFRNFFESKHDCCGYYTSAKTAPERCEDISKIPDDSCYTKLHDTYNDNKKIIYGIALTFTIVLVIVIILCMLCAVYEFLRVKDQVTNDDEYDEYDSLDSANDPDGGDTENPDASDDGSQRNTESQAASDDGSQKNTENQAAAKKGKAEKAKNKNAVQPIDDEEVYSDAEANKKLEQEIFFGKPNIDPYEADPYEN